MTKSLAAVKPLTVFFKYQSLRNISSPEDAENERKVLSGHAPITSLADLPTDDNVREYLLEAEGRKRRKPAGVHRAILNTLENYPHKFAVLNGGVVIIARDHEVDEQKKTVKLIEPSIINGAQTQGVIKDFLQELSESSNPIPNINVKFELIVTSDDSLIGEIAISRNYQNDVQNLSIAGRLGQLDELENALQRKNPGMKLRKSETELSDTYEQTERLLQVLAALTPTELLLQDKDPNKVYAYTSKAKCLKDFQTLYKVVKGEQPPEKNIPKEKYVALYQFYLDVAPQAYSLHDRWKHHQGFKGTALRALKRDKLGNIIDIPDGIIFPILASLSAFAEKTNNGWEINPPGIFRDEELINTAKSVYMEIANSDPPQMGKSKACYSALLQITSIYKKLSN